MFPEKIVSYYLFCRYIDQILRHFRCTNCSDVDYLSTFNVAGSRHTFYKPLDLVLQGTKCPLQLDDLSLVKQLSGCVELIYHQKNQVNKLLPICSIH